MRPAPDILHTARLVLTRPVPADEPELAAILRDPRVAATLTDDGRPPSAEAVQAQHLAKIEHWQRFGFGLWTARERSSGALVGRGGLQHAFAQGLLDEVEAAWTIAPGRWGEGLAGELAAACVEVAFGPLELPQVIALTTVENAASLRVMERAGFRFERTMRDLDPPLVLYVRARC